MRRGRRVLAAGMAFFLTIPSMLGTSGITVLADGTDGKVEVPDPYYEFTFDQELLGEQGKLVPNEGTKQDVTASIDGSGSGLGVVEDTERNSKVLNLPGGGMNQGCLTLPDTMFDEVGQEGFAFSFWIKVDKSAEHYNRIFEASSIGLNSEGWPFNAPEFTFVVGGTDTAASRYNSSLMLSDRKNQAKLIWDEAFTKEKWQHVTISVNPENYDIYLDGQLVNKTDANKNLASVLGKMFNNDCAELKKYTHNAIGRSVYNTDNDLKAKIDEFRFYNTALDSAQAMKAYESYKVDESITAKLDEEIEKAEALRISFYTRETYDALMTKVSEAKEVSANPVTEANVNRMISELQTAEENLVFYEGVDAGTVFHKAQLVKELAAAETYLEEPLTEESLTALKNALDQAKTAADGQDQGAVDLALKALREAVAGLSYGPTLHFDMSGNTGDMLHGSTGFLYGVSENNVPSADLLEAIAPKILVQKAADGKQHPSGDGYRLTSFLESCGVENIQIYLQDYYLQWPYEYNGIDDYNTKVKDIVSKMLEGKSREEVEQYSFVLFNEPDGIWYGSDVKRLCNDWMTIYNTVKSISPYAKVAGPNYAGYNSSAYETFFKFCSENNCLPDYITWHELQKGSLTSYQGHYNQVMALVDKYYADSEIDPILFVNETVNFEDVGAPGPLVNWISIFEETKVYASLPYWGLANSLNELAADANEPNGAWWVYKWYADMSGYTVPMTKENVENPSSYGCLYGLGSVDQENQMVQVLFGGQAGPQTISLDNIGDLPAFVDADSAHVKIYSTKYTGHHGFADDIPVEFEGNVALNGESLTFSVSDAELMDAYYAVITPAVSQEITTPGSYKKTWTRTYEAENAALIGGAKAYTKNGGSDLARSNRAEVGGMNQEGDGVNFHVSVPSDGTYRLNVYYSSQAPQVDPLSLKYVASGGQNRAIGAISRHKLSVDGTEKEIVEYKSTVKWGYYNYKTVYLDLTAGEHSIQLDYTGENQNGKDVNSMLCALLDKIDLTYVENPDACTLVIEPEEVTGRNPDFTLAQAEGTSGAGYAEGSGELKFYVNAPQEGFYTMNLLAKGQGNLVVAKNSVDYAPDAAAESEIGVSWLPLGELSMNSSDAFSACQGPKIYLAAGMNQIRISSETMAGLDQITFTKDSTATEEGTLTVEAEDCVLNGTDNGDGYNYLPGSTAVPQVKENSYASGGSVVEGFRGGGDNEISFQVNASADGNYKLSLYYANNEPAPVMQTQSGANYVHPYNTDLVERYAQICVNGETPQTVYFRNTLCWDVFHDVVMDVTLKKGTNTITISNDNSYKFSSVQDDFAPRFDKFVLAAATYGNTVTSVNQEPEKTVDKTGLNLAVTMAEKLEAQQTENSCFTADSWIAVEEALTLARTLKDKETATQSEVDETFLKLMTACNLLENGVQKMGLKAAIEGAEAVLADAASLEKYEAASVEKLRQELADAKQVYHNSGMSQAQVNAATTGLLTAVTSLLVKEELTRLDILIATAEELLNNGDQYTSATLLKLKEACDSAKEVAADKQADADTIQAAYDKLAEAMTSLVRKGSKEELKNALDKAAEIQSQSVHYLESSIQGLEQIIREARQDYDNPDADTEQVGQALKRLIDEILKARLIGDVDLNGIVDTGDSYKVLQFDAELVNLTGEQLQIADVNGDGVSDSQDAAKILQFAAEKITSFR